MDFEIYVSNTEWKELEDSGLAKRKVKKVTYDPHQPTVIGESEYYRGSDIVIMPQSHNSGVAFAEL